MTTKHEQDLSDLRKCCEANYHLRVFSGRQMINLLDELAQQDVLLKEQRRLLEIVDRNNEYYVGEKAVSAHLRKHEGETK